MKADWFENRVLIYLCPPIPIWFSAERLQVALNGAVCLGAIWFLFDLSVSHAILAAILWAAAIVHSFIVVDRSPGRDQHDDIGAREGGDGMIRRFLDRDDSVGDSAGGDD